MFGPNEKLLEEGLLSGKCKVSAEIARCVETLLQFGQSTWVGFGQNQLQVWLGVLNMCRLKTVSNEPFFTKKKKITSKVQDNISCEVNNFAKCNILIGWSITWSRFRIFIPSSVPKVQDGTK